MEESRMDQFPIYSEDSAPEDSKLILDQVKKQYGFIPNLLGIMAESTDLLQGYLTLSTLFSQTTLTTIEQQIVLLSSSAANCCDYCMAAHGKMALQAGVEKDLIDSIFNGETLSNQKLEALNQFVFDVVATRGFPTEKVTQNFLDQGYTQKNILEVILGVGMKTLSNYTNHIAHTPIDQIFK